MATIVLSAAGLAAGGSIGGSVLGLSMATIGRAAGAAIGRRIDQQLLGAGSEPVETGRVDRFRLTGATEGADLQQIYGRMRVPGQVIWASEFRESRKTSGSGGKGGPPQSETTTYSYTVNLAIGLCEGEISRVGRVWADGQEIFPEDLNMRVYTGTFEQQPDPKIAAVEGLENTPAYRGTAYVVLEDLALGQFGNRVPQLTFEVMRPSTSTISEDLTSLVKGVALIPGTGEYGLATSPVYLSPSYGERVGMNTNSPLAQTDLTASLDALEGELPACRSVVMVVSWFGDDLRCSTCQIEPKVEQRDVDAESMPWSVSGRNRSGASVVPFKDSQPVYGGTPTDASVVQALRDMRDRGLETVFYPFILMEQLEGNALPNPWTGETEQPSLPWRGRITTSLSPNQEGTPDGTAAAEAEVAAFMGSASVSDFRISGSKVIYSGPDEWSYRRFILHYAYLCLAAGGVHAFCIGSEMRGLTQIRGENNSFPAVNALITLAADVRNILGPDCKISYAADWSEYHGYQPSGTADKLFHLDPLWADQNIDFIGVDNYMPLADWRDGADHADAGAGSIYSLDYLKSNVAGGEGYDWFYSSPEARDSQRRTTITDSDGEPWVWRYKDFQGWWGNQHHNRIDGVRQPTPTAWEPRSKPIWFTEFGCAALDKGANQPNKFLDPKSSESRLPYYSNGNRDDFMQMQYLRAMQEYFEDDTKNPVSTEYEGRMVDTSRLHVWAWDARPYPFFPGNRTLWSDGANYSRGHWLNGRATNRSLASVVSEICDRSGVPDYDVSRLYGVVRGYTVSDVSSARSALQPLMLAYGFEAIESNGILAFRNRSGNADHVISDNDLAIDPDKDQSVALTRAPAVEMVGRVQLAHLDADRDYEAIAAEAVHSDEVSFAVSRSEASLALTRGEGQSTVTRWLEEARIGRNTASFALPPSFSQVGPGDVVSLDTEKHAGLYRVDRLEESGVRLVEASRVDPEVYQLPNVVDETAPLRPFIAPLPVELAFMDLPLLTGDEVPHAPHIAVGGRPWPGSIAVYGAAQDSGYTLQAVVREPSTIGLTTTQLLRGQVGIWDRQQGFEVEFIDGQVSSASVEALLAGENTMAIGDGSADLWEVLQFRNVYPVGDSRFKLQGLLRGQAGSRGLMPEVWPVGSRVVLLNGTPEQINLPSAARGLARHFRYGPAKRPVTDASYRHDAQLFKGNGLRPYPIAHLRASNAAGNLMVSWIRCSRIDGDVWADGEIPLGEDAEEYVVRVVHEGAMVREEVIDVSKWTYSAADRLSDVGTSPFLIEVAQLSARFGAGPFVKLVVDVTV